MHQGRNYCDNEQERERDACTSVSDMSCVIFLQV